MSCWRTAWSMVGRWLVYVPNPEGGEEQFSLPEHMKAEAFVMGASHDLLKALELLLNDYVRLAEESGCDLIGSDRDPEVVRARAALAKARGQ